MRQDSQIIGHFVVGIALTSTGQHAGCAAIACSIVHNLVDQNDCEKRALPLMFDISLHIIFVKNAQNLAFNSQFMQNMPSTLDLMCVRATSRPGSREMGLQARIGLLQRRNVWEKPFSSVCAGNRFSISC